jgi:hypothetical protein
VNRLPLALFLSLAGLRAAQAEGALRADGHLDTAAVRDAYLRSDIPQVRAALEGFIKSHPRDVGAAEKAFTHLYLGATYAGETEGRAKAEAHFRAALKLDPYCDPANLYLPPAIKTWFERLRADVLREQAQGPSAPDHPRQPVRPSPPLPRNPARADLPPARARWDQDQPPGPAPRPAAAPADTAARGTSIPAQAPVPSAPRPDGTTADTGADTATDMAAREASVAPPAARGWLWWTLGGAAAVAAGAGAFAWIESETKPGPRRVEVDATLK